MPTALYDIIDALLYVIEESVHLFPSLADVDKIDILPKSIYYKLGRQA